ncbi:MAG TPA: type IV toxin-antitoxin system AbiEi family antitoxin domain-containing protein [Actinomycetota bacterium]|nr:type IV toxin-antitoxin system AbiEi family antitoxin domain-containing protein [Actinomycetota bacterium]
MTTNDIDGRVARLAARQFGVMSRAQVMATGMSPGMIKVRLRTERWHEMYQGVYRVAGVPGSWRQRLMAATLACDGSGVSHEPAAALWALPSFPEQAIAVIVPRGGRRSTQFVVHRATNLIAGDIVRLGPIPVTSAVRTFIDICATVSGARIEAALDDAIRRGLLTAQRLVRRIDVLGRGRAGIRALRELALDRATLETVPQTVLESIMLSLVRAAGLPDPCLQHSIGRWFADFAYPDARLVVEVDGFRWHGADRGRWQSDLARQNELIAAGWRVVRFTWDDVTRRPAGVAATLRRMLQVNR